MTVRVPRLPFSVDPLIAEAKRRARQRRVLVALIAVVVFAAGAALTVELRGLGSVAPMPANLRVLVVGDVGTFGQNGERALFHLKCDPASGNVADPAKACAAIASQPSLIPKSYTDRGGEMWYFRITGSLNGKPVHFIGGGTGVPLIDKLGLAGRHGNLLHLEPRRHAFVGMNQTRRFAPGVLRPADLVICRVDHSYRGPPLAMSVPVHRGLEGEVSSTPGLMAIRIRADGAVLASCLARDRLPLDKRGRTTLPTGWPPKSLRS